MLVGMQILTAVLKDWQFLAKLNRVLLYDPVIMLLDIYPTNLKIYAHTKTYRWIFIAALLIIIKNLEQLVSPSIGEWETIQQ